MSPIPTAVPTSNRVELDPVPFSHEKVTLEPGSTEPGDGDVITGLEPLRKALN
jgi:hypothetical protein